MGLSGKTVCVCTEAHVRGLAGKEGQQEDIRNPRAEKAGLESSEALLQLPEAEATGKRRKAVGQTGCIGAFVTQVTSTLSQFPSSRRPLGFLIKVS